MSGLSCRSVSAVRAAPPGTLGGDLRGFVKLKKFKKSEKNSEVGGWVKPQLGFEFFWGNSVFLVFFCVVFMFPIFSQKNKKNG